MGACVDTITKRRSLWSNKRECVLIWPPSISTLELPQPLEDANSKSPLLINLLAVEFKSVREGGEG